MKKVLFLSGSLMLLLSSCLHSFKKVPNGEGLEYKIIPGGSDKKIKNGDYFELWMDVTYKDARVDTVLRTSEKTGTQTVLMDSTQIPPVFYKLFQELKEKDSLVMRIPTDSMMKTGQAPPFIRKGEFVIWHYKILHLYTTKEQADSARESQLAQLKTKDSIQKIKQLEIDDKLISDYLAKSNIKTEKSSLGTFVAIQSQGTGNLIDTSVEVEVNYTGKTLAGKTFDSNTDSAFHHVKPISVKMWLPNGGMIEGFADALKLLSKGAKATLYIPSSLAYGERGGGDAVKPNENLIFDIEVVDVLSKAQAEAKDEAERKKMMELRQHYMDSVAQAQKKNPVKEVPPASHP